ncbi:UbiA family prenyltransferase [Streptosporangium fragile]|uniref:UbiA family prenyltransferase n=1 Tax=Streptosporangium fragile TaxID=46186 RepID=A0ABP6IAI0_9ACTN
MTGTCEHAGPPHAQGIPLRPWAVREAVLTWRFVYRDLSSTIIPTSLFVGAAAVHHGLPAGPALWAAGKNALWTFLYLYTFCVSNQIAGVEEDRANKPDRPLPSGLVTTAGARRRWGAAMALFTVAGFALDVLLWTLLWQAVTIFHNFGGWGRWGPTKNLCMVLGTIAQLAAAWTMAGPLDGTAWRWILAISLIIAGAAVHIQDLRDMAGDRLAGRRTLPLLLGERATRRHLAVGVAVMPILLALILYVPEEDHIAAAACALVLTAVCWTIAWRVVRRRTPADDHQTYLLYTYMFCYVLLSGVVVL